MKITIQLPATKDELEQMDVSQKSALWARYSPHPFRRQVRALWYYIQCERLNLKLNQKYITIFRKYMNKPDECLTKAYKNKYHLNPGATITKTFRGLKFTVLVGDDGEFIYNNKTYKSLSAVAREICGKKVSGNNFFGLDNKRIHNAKN